MSNDKSGAGYGNHAGDEPLGGQDGAKSDDYEPGKPVDGIEPGSEGDAGQTDTKDEDADAEKRQD